MDTQMMSAPGSVGSASITRRQVAVSDSLLHPNPLVHRILSARGIADASQLQCSLADLAHPDALPDIDKAIDRLLRARELGERIVIVGDYDCDGATSTTVAMLGLAMLGFNDVDYLIPDRFKFGYGLSESVVDLAIEAHAAQLILTVDNGVASISGVAHANSRGVDVLVTDHHLPTDVLPSAVAIVNPVLAQSTFAGRFLAGVGVIFYVLLALRARLARGDDPCGRAPLAQLLDLVAIGTVADLVPLDHTNRILVEQGLRRMRAGHTRPGVQALISASGKTADQLSSQDIGFGIGPRLNAAGRLDDMRIGVQCLLSESEQDAIRLADQLNALNQKRRSIEGEMQRDADSLLSEVALDSTSGAETFAICLMHASWHQGVMGILAGRLKEKHHLPVVIFARDGDCHLKGSARSVPGVHIRDVLQSIAARHPSMIDNFGGHAMAAGLKLSATQFESFRSAFNDAVRSVLKGRRPKREYLTDGGLTGAERSIDNARLLSLLLPWGQGFEPPLFDDSFIVHSSSVAGGKHLKLKLRDVDDSHSGKLLEAIAFNQSCQLVRGDQIRLIYSLDVNHWRGVDTVQLRIHYLEPASMR
jgi:single-stranded-DNA-specific exonuclease